MLAGIPLAGKLEQEVRAYHLVRIRKLPMEITLIIAVTSTVREGGEVRGRSLITNYRRQENNVFKGGTHLVNTMLECAEIHSIYGSGLKLLTPKFKKQSKKERGVF